jgi:hypothetical protein
MNRNRASAVALDQNTGKFRKNDARPRERNLPGIERARALVAQNRCNICHTATFAGQDNVPNIADQREDYLVAAIGTIPATATTPPWPKSCSRSATIRFWISLITSRGSERGRVYARLRGDQP